MVMMVLLQYYYITFSNGFFVALELNVTGCRVEVAGFPELG